mgnify:FL=1
MDGKQPYSVFDKSLIAAGPNIHSSLLEYIRPKTLGLKDKGYDFDRWYYPEGYERLI